MAKKLSPATPAQHADTAERAERLYRLLRLLARGPQTRDALTRRLRLDVRSFYRDLELLRAADIDIPLRDGRYSVEGDVEDAVTRLPLPDPVLTLGEAQQLAKGRTPAHRKLKGQIAAIMG